jgi:hypothetical protein
MQPILDAVNAANKAEAQLVVPKSERTLNDAIADWRKLIAPNRKPRGLQTTESHLKAHIVPGNGLSWLSSCCRGGCHAHVLKG